MYNVKWEVINLKCENIKKGFQSVFHVEKYNEKCQYVEKLSIAFSWSCTEIKMQNVNGQSCCKSINSIQLPLRALNNQCSSQIFFFWIQIRASHRAVLCCLLEDSRISAPHRSVLCCLEDCRIPQNTQQWAHCSILCKISDIYAKCKLLRMLKKRKHSIGIASPISNFQKGASNILKTCASARFSAVQWKQPLQIQIGQKWCVVGLPSGLRGQKSFSI